VAARICGNLSGAEKGGVPVWAGFAAMAHGLTIIVLRLSLCIQKSSLLVYAAFTYNPVQPDSWYMPPFQRTYQILFKHGEIFLNNSQSNQCQQVKEFA
jgi:hypothetical protein